MSPKFLKILSHEMSETLSNIFDESFALGVFPDHMKFAMITPLFKGVLNLMSQIINQSRSLTNHQQSTGETNVYKTNKILR